MYKFFCAIVVSGLLSFQALAQAPKSTARMPIDETSKLITYSKVNEVAGQSKDVLFDRALEWATGYYKNPTDVIREKDKEGGKMVCKARYKISNPPDKKGVSTDAGLVQYTLNIQFKEGRYKYELTEINWKQISYYPAEKWMDTANAYYKPEFEFYLQQVDQQSKEILKSLEKACAVAKAANTKDNW